MFNTKFVLANGQEIYPGYLDAEKRQKLKEEIGERRKVMWCGCQCSTEKRLYYRLSEDLRIYPEHNNYVHDRYCSRYKNADGEAERQTAYLISEENGEVTAYLSFNPKNFDLKEDVEVEQDNKVPEETLGDENTEEVIIEKDKTIKEAEKKEPKLSLSGLIRSINADTFTEKILSGKNVTDKDEFSKNVFYRMKKIHIARMQKNIGELSLEKDGVRFIYLPFAGAVKKKERGLVKCYIKTPGKDGEIYNNFLFEETLTKAVKQFKKQYGIVPDENTMIAGFQYLKKGRNSTTYRVLGRIHLFQVSNLGVYCKNMAELNVFNEIHEICQKNKNLKLWIPPEDESVSGIISLTGMEKKILLLSRSGKDERVVYNPDEYIPLIVNEIEHLTEGFLYSYFESMEETYDYDE